MSNFSGYKTKAFSESQKFFVLDPNTGTPSFVQGSDLVAQLTPNSTYVFSEPTRTTAQTTDYELGAVIQTGGATATGDGQAGVYLVVAAGEGDFPMDNGLELLTLAGDDTLLERLALNTVGDGSDLVAHTGTSDTVTEALDKRTIYVGSVAELEALSLPAGYSIYLTQEGRAGEFVVKTGTPPSDPQKGIYIVLANGNYAERACDPSEANVLWFGATGSDDSDAYIAALGSGRPHITGSKSLASVITKPLYIPDSVKIIDLNFSSITYTREQTGSGFESLLYSNNRTEPLKILNGKLKYTGTFDFGPSYSGRVNGIEINAASEFSGLSIENVEASGFNIAGVEIAKDLASSYIKNVSIKNCNLHHNRVAGVWYGFVDGISVTNNILQFNGAEADGGTGYGCAGIKQCYPKNILVANNDASYNWRKGIDLHSGFNALIDGNKVYKNRYYGIWCVFTNDVSGSIQPVGSLTISNNEVESELYDAADIALIPTLYGISFGLDSVSQLNMNAEPTRVVVSGNNVRISGDTSTADIYPYWTKPTNFENLSVKVSDNIFSSSEFTSAVFLRGPTEDVPYGVVDFIFSDNVVKCPNAKNNIVELFSSDAVYNVRHFCFDNNLFDVKQSDPTAYPISIVASSNRHPDSTFQLSNNTFNTYVTGAGTTFPFSSDEYNIFGNMLNGLPLKDYRGGYGESNDLLDSYYEVSDRAMYKSPTTHIGRICTAAGYNARNTWQSSTLYQTGDWVKLSGGRTLVCTNGGTSSTTEPTDPGGSGVAITDGSVTWLTRSLQPTFTNFGAIV